MGAAGCGGEPATGAAPAGAAALGPAENGPTPMFCIARASSRCLRARATSGSLRRPGSWGSTGTGGAEAMVVPPGEAPSEAISTTSPAGSASPRRRSAESSARPCSRVRPGEERTSFAVAAAASFRTAAASGSVQEKDASRSA